MTSLDIAGKPAWPHQHSRSLSAEFLFLPHRPFKTSCTITTNLSRTLVIVTLVGSGVPNAAPNVVQLQHSSLSNNTSVTSLGKFINWYFVTRYILCSRSFTLCIINRSTYVHRMIISPPCLFKHTKNDERVAMLFQCLLDHTQQKLPIFVSFRCEK